MSFLKDFHFLSEVECLRAEHLCWHSSFAFKNERQRSLFDRMIYNTALPPTTL